MMRTISLPAGVAVFAFLALAGLMGLFAFSSAAPAWAQDGMTISHAENDEGAVAMFTAEDPEGVMPVTWAIAASTTDFSQVAGIADADNVDASDFDIDDDGMLKFAIGDGDDDDPPDFENPMGGVTDNTTCDVTAPPNPCTNTYKVVVAASDMETGGMTGYHKVTVTVTDEDEDGEVTWTTDAAADGTADDPKLMQFHVGTLLTASATDGDIAGTAKDVPTTATWRWYRSSSKTAMGTMIDSDDAEDNTYTVTTADVGMYLRAEVYYVVTGNVDQENVSLTSDYPVVAIRAGANELKFDPTTVSREVDEGKKGMMVGAPVTATGNHGVVNYTLGNATNGVDNGRFKIDQKTGQITTMVDLDFDATTVGTAAGSEGQCVSRNECKVTVMATDASGSATDETAAANVFMDATVTIKIKDVNEKPEFDEGTEGVPQALKAIKRDENQEALFEDGALAGQLTVAAGATYTATDPEDRRITYRLMGPDGAKFSLSVSQVLSFKEKPDYEMPGDANRDNVYEVTVRATDITGMDEDRMVKVTVMDEDEGPEITGRDSVSHAENDEGAVATFTAEDPEGITPITWTIAASTTDFSQVAGIADADNVDASDFDIDDDGMLKFAIGDDDDPPDFENPMGGVTDNTTCDVTAPPNPCTNTYKVVVAASDMETDGMMGYHKVTVMVTDVAEKGKVSWTTDAAADGTADDPKLMQFHVGTLLTASATDGDIAGTAKDVPTPIWRWYRGGSRISGTDAEDNTYTVTTADVTSRLRAMVTYTVAGSTTQENASLTSDYPVVAVRAGDNELKFDPVMVSREVDEGKKGMMVGAPVTATGNHGAVNYKLDGDGEDNAKFKIDQKTGQITTDADLDFEADAADDNCIGNDDECIVTVTATDASGDAVPTNATVTIKITDVNEKPEFDEGTEGVPQALKAIKRDENQEALFEDGALAGQLTVAAGATYTATDPEGGNVNLTLMGPDGAKFSLSSMDVLSFKEKPDYEMPGDANRDNVYEVTVRATDITGMDEDRMVKVTVMNVDEGPEIIQGGLGISGSSSMTVPEISTDAVETFTAKGPMKDRASWTLEGADRMYFSVSPARGAMTELSFRNAPDYEMPRGMAMSDTNTNTYMVTLKANDGTDMDTHDVTVMVTNMEEDGTVTLSPMNPVVDTELTAILTDPDVVTKDTVTWQWSKSMPMDGTFMDIPNAMSMSYTPMAADKGYYLRATATYTDGYGDDMAMATTTSAVVSNNAPVFADGDSTTRTVAENTAAGMNIGTPVMATDADDDTLTYALGGADMARFGIDPATGQLMTKAMLNYEMPRGQAMSETNTNDYMVTVTATDPDGASDSITVTIMVTDIEDELAARYDTNGTPGIQKDEVIKAINDYLFGEGDDAISKADVIELINLYLFG